MQVNYATVAGAYIQGAPLLGPGPWTCRIVGAGYQQVCGQATAWGDGVVPVVSAHLDGAQQLTLKGVYHSPLGADEGGSAASDAEDEVSPIAAALHLNEIENRVETTVLKSSDLEIREDESPSRIEEAAAAFVPEGPRLWYGSKSVLGLWVHLLHNESDMITATNTGFKAVRKQ